jgi:hypothetical protein
MVTAWCQQKQDVGQLAMHVESWIKGKYGRGIYHQRESILESTRMRTIFL